MDRSIRDLKHKSADIMKTRVTVSTMSIVSMRMEIKSCAISTIQSQTTFVLRLLAES